MRTFLKMLSFTYNAYNIPQKRKKVKKNDKIIQNIA